MHLDRTMAARLAVFVAVVAAAGCSRLRFVVDTMPATDHLTEAVVMEDRGVASASKIALIDVSGLIANAERPGLLAPGENPVSRFVESLQLAAADSQVKAVIIQINSPGGTVTASDLMHREVVHFRRTTGKPVVVCMADIAASGGYYLACAGDEIIAHPTTVTGSIGVIIQTLNVSEGLSRIGIRAESFTSGPNKNMGTPFEEMTAEHRELLQGLVDEFYANFRAVVLESRKTLSPGDLDWVTDGRVVTGKRAVEVGLVDKLGDLRDAFAAAKARANLPAARLVKYHRPVEYVGSPYASAPLGASTQINMLQLNLAAGAGDCDVGFYYLWDPGAW